MCFHYLTFQIASVSAIEVGVALVIVGGALYNWYNRTPIPANPILPTTLDRLPAAPEPPQESASPPLDATDEVPFMGVEVTDPIEQVKRFFYLPIPGRGSFHFFMFYCKFADFHPFLFWCCLLYYRKEEEKTG